MRHIPVSIFAIVAIVGIMTLLLSVSLIPEPVMLAVQYVGPSATPGGNTVIVRLDVGEFLGDEITAVSESQLVALRRGTVHAKEISTDYTQSIRFKESGVLNGAHVVFGRDEQNTVSDFLQYDSGDSLFKYQIEFSPGLRSEVEGGSLPDIEDEEIELLGDSYTIVDTKINTASKSISIKMFGGFGSVELEDSNYGDDVYVRGVEINGQNIDAEVKIKATESGGKVTVYSISYLPAANAVRGGDVQVLPLHCTRQYLQDPQAMFSPNFDICYKGLGAAAAGIPTSGISGNEVLVRPRGDDEYAMIATNNRGQTYDIPLAQLPGSCGNRGRDFIFKEAAAPGAPNIDLDDYFLVSHRNDRTGVSNVLRLDRIEGNTVYVEDLSGSQRSSTFDPGTGEGQFLIGDGTYKFVVTGNALAMDQTNDGDINGGEAKFVFAGGTRADFSAGCSNVKIITPSSLFDEPAGDETTDFNVVFGGHIDLVVPSPQATVAGYTFQLQGAGGGVKQGLTKYGILFTWDQESDSDDLKLVVPGAYAGGVRGGAGAEVYITIERAKLIKKTEVPAPLPKCGDRIIVSPEYCDPPGSACADLFKRVGVCSADCSTCEYKPPMQCGNNLLEPGEECENMADCPAGFGCQSCKCSPLPASAPVCGNNLLDRGEQCENAVDCGPGYNCINCFCSPLPTVERPVEVRPNIFARFFLWLANLFGWGG